jgi:hypothetical protein
MRIKQTIRRSSGVVELEIDALANAHSFPATLTAASKSASRLNTPISEVDVWTRNFFVVGTDIVLKRI